MKITLNNFGVQTLNISWLSGAVKANNLVISACESSAHVEDWTETK